MENIELEAEKRELKGKKLKGLRKMGLIPAVVYGKKFKSLTVAVNSNMFEKKVLSSGAGRNALISLKMAGAKDIPVITSDIQRNPLTDSILHIDFSYIVMDEAIKTKVPIELTGLPVGVKETGGILIHGLREIEVECLPKDIPDKYTIDVAALNIGDSLHVSDLTGNDKVKIMTNPSEMIANCSPPTKEEEVAAPVPTPEEVAAAAAVEGAPAEGEAKPAAAGAAPAKEKGAKEEAPAAKAPAKSAAKPEKK